MADYSVTSPSEAFGMQFYRMAGQIRCAMPGIIISFDPATQTATVQPAIKMKVNLGDGVKQMDLPVITNVPVVLPFAQTAGLLLTLPIKPGDECLLVFADRSIDNFTQGGGVQPTVATASDDTTTPRAHSLSDAICIPGIISNPQAVPDYNEEHIELRDRERKQYISLGPDGITITDGTAKWTMSGGTVKTTAPGGNYVDAPNMQVREDNTNDFAGELRADEVRDKNNTGLGTHDHGGVQSGAQNTASPNAGS